MTEPSRETPNGPAGLKVTQFPPDVKISHLGMMVYGLRPWALPNEVRRHGIGLPVHFVGHHECAARHPPEVIAHCDPSRAQDENQGQHHTAEDSRGRNSFLFYEPNEDCHAKSHKEGIA